MGEVLVEEDGTTVVEVVGSGDGVMVGTGDGVVGSGDGVVGSGVGVVVGSGIGEKVVDMEGKCQELE